MKDLTKSRNEDFARRCIEIYEAEAKRGNFPPLDEILFKVMAMKPRSYYVTFDTASRQLHRIRRHGMDSVVRNRYTRKLWAELEEQIVEVMARYPKKKFDSALTFVLNFRSPSSYFINIETARRIIRPYMSFALRRKSVV